MEYNIQTSRIFFSTSDNNVCICCPSGELDIEIVASRDLPEGSPYWIIDFETMENMEQQFYPFRDFNFAMELDLDVLGPPHGIALGHTEYYRVNGPGTLGVGSN